MAMKKERKPRKRFIWTIVILVILLLLTFSSMISTRNTNKELNQANEELKQDNLLLGETVRDYKEVINSQNEQIRRGVGFNIESVKYLKEENAIQSRIEPLDITLDYNTCLDYVDGAEDSYANLKEYNQKIIDYYSFVTESINRSDCSSLFPRFIKEQKRVEELNDDLIEKTKNWCTGYHKVDWTDEWEDIYQVPLENSLKQFEAELKIWVEADNDLSLVCNKGLY